MKLTVVMDLQKRIVAAENRLKSLREMETAMTSRLDGLPKSNVQVSRVEKVATQIVDTERRIAPFSLKQESLRL